MSLEGLMKYLVSSWNQSISTEIVSFSTLWKAGDLKSMLLKVAPLESLLWNRYQKEAEMSAEMSPFQGVLPFFLFRMRFIFSSNTWNQSSEEQIMLQSRVLMSILISLLFSFRKGWSKSFRTRLCLGGISVSVNLLSVRGILPLGWGYVQLRNSMVLLAVLLNWDSILLRLRGLVSLVLASRIILRYSSMIDLEKVMIISSGFLILQISSTTSSMSQLKFLVIQLISLVVSIFLGLLRFPSMKLSLIRQFSGLMKELDFMGSREMIFRYYGKQHGMIRGGVGKWG